MAPHTTSLAPVSVSGTSTLNSMLDAVTARVIHSMNVTVLAERTGIPRRQLYMYATPASNPSGEHRDLPAKRIIPLTLATGRTDILEHLAAEAAGLFVRRPDVSRSLSAVLEHIAALCTEFADVQRGCAAMLADGVVSPAEAGVIDRELADLQTEAEALRLRVRHAVTDRKPLAKSAAR